MTGAKQQRFVVEPTTPEYQREHGWPWQLVDVRAGRRVVMVYSRREYAQADADRLNRRAEREAREEEDQS